VVDTLLYSSSLKQQSSCRHVAVLYLTETTVLRETRCCTLSHWNNSPRVVTLPYSSSSKQQFSWVVSVSWSTATCLPKGCCFSEIEYVTCLHEDCCFSELVYSNVSTWGLFFQWDRVQQHVYMRTVVSVSRSTTMCLPEDCCFSEIEYSNMSTWGLLFRWTGVQQRVYLRTVVKQQSSGRHIVVLRLTEKTVLMYTCCCTLSHWKNSPHVDTLLYTSSLKQQSSCRHVMYSISLKQQPLGRHVAVLQLTETTVLM
jgi:hypothetical protein